MRRTITTSQRASPTLALLMPARLAIRISQLFSCEQPLSGQYDMDGIVECRAQQTIVYLADPAGASISPD